MDGKEKTGSIPAATGCLQPCAGNSGFRLFSARAPRFAPISRRRKRDTDEYLSIAARSINAKKIEEPYAQRTGNA
jgi:hypothetical protein